MTEWQNEWDRYHRDASEQSRAVDVERTRIQHLEAHLENLRERLRRLEAEEHGLAAESTSRVQGGQLEERAAGVNESLDALRSEMRELGTRIEGRRAARSQLEESLDRQRRECQELEKHHASLDAVQQVALGKQESSLAGWLEMQGLTNERRLAEDLEVEPGWERAVETVLGLNLEAVCVSSSGSSLAQSLESLQGGTVTLFDTAVNAKGRIGSLAEPLSNRVRAPWNLDGLLNGVYAVDGIGEAVALRPRLQAHESVITRSGVWIGADWLRVVDGGDGNSGVLVREQELREIAQSLEQSAQQAIELERRLREADQELDALEQTREECRRRLDEAGLQQAEVRAEISRRDASLEQIGRRREGISNESSDIRTLLSRDEAGLDEARRRLEQLNAGGADQERRHQQLLQHREQLRAELDRCRGQAQTDRQTMRDVAVRIESARSRLAALQSGLERVERQLAQLQRQHQDLKSQLSGGEQPIAEMKEELEQLLTKRLEIENRLGDARRQLEAREQELRVLDDKRAAAEQEVQDQRSRLEELRISSQETTVLRRTLLEQINESGHRLEALLEQLSAEADEAEWQRQIGDIEQKISRMGAINLAAIEEFSEQTERKNYLDAQLADLNDALATLENAIRKIDNETRMRFKETFDLVNEHMHRLYPKLFGGGVARLEMTSDDLLEAGVAVTARPPGKRNVNIHQLSGGEKALTAVALVFALFELNPAPFCMLDEVDAPLDDSNAARFCSLVREMSDRVQFIVITHNKITMELANQLIGVTMNEPGVSRLVAVDVEEAVEMAVG